MIKKLILNCSLFVAISLGAFSVHAVTVPVSLTATPDPLGEGWGFECTISIFGACLAWGVTPTEDHSIGISLSDGWTDVFDVSFQTTYADPSGLATGVLMFTPGANTRGELVPLDNVFADFLFSGILYDLNFNVLDPERFLYTLDGTTYTLPDDLVIPLPTAMILFVSGLLGLMGVANRLKAG